MRCPSCARQQKFKEGMTCKSCGYIYTFSPKDPPKITDRQFKALIRSVSGNGTYWFTLDQLHAQYCRRSYRGPRGPLIVFGVALAVIAACWLIPIVPSDLATAVSIVSGIVAVFGAVKTILAFFPSPPDSDLVETLVERWEKDGKPIDLLIREPGLDEPPPEWAEPDLFDYGVERLLIVERDLLVDLLVRNGLHAEQRALILSEGGYPSYLVPIARKMLTARPDLPVFLLHDSEPGQEPMEGRVRRLGLLPIEDHPVIDLGLFPSDLSRMPKMKPVEPHPGSNVVPVDALLYATLTGSLALAFERQVPLAALMLAASEGGDSGLIIMGDFG